MIDMLALIAKFQAQNLMTRINEHSIARDWSRGRWDSTDRTRDNLLPKPTDVAGQDAFNRLQRQVQSAGPRALRAKLDAAIGTINWGGDNPNQIDAKLSALELDALAEKLATDALITGIAAVIASTPIDGQPAEISRLSGYLEPILKPGNVDRITGLFQCWQELQGNKPVWIVRVYDFDELEMREWRNLGHPGALAGTPTITANASMPRVFVPYMDDDGLVLGEFVIALPRLKALYATEFRLLRVEELAAFPRLLLKGDVKVENAGSPASILRASKDGGDAKFLEPGNMEQLRHQRSSRREDLRDDLALPGGFLGNDSPSGEALREANTRYYQASRKLAQQISRLLSNVVRDYSVLEDVTDPPNVVVNPNYEFMRDLVVQNTLALHGAGLIPLAIATREIQVFFPGWADEDMEAFIASREGVVDPASVQALLGG